MSRIAIAILTLAASAAFAQTIPRKAPDFVINLNGGKRLSLADYKGKGVIVVFILTTCSHCQETTGLLTKLQKEYGPRGLQVLESAIDQGAEAFVPRFIQQFGPSFPVGFNQFQQAQEFMQHPPMKIMHMPGLVFIDRQGNIVAQHVGSDPEMADGVQEKNLRGYIEKILAAPRAPGSKSGAKKAGKSTTTKKK
jgi:cytochrome oxidase Cu insertion factor (SCO1/SenC/PrrC family)